MAQFGINTTYPEDDEATVFEKFITIQLSKSCSKYEFKENLQHGSNIPFVLTTSFSLIVSNSLHDEIRKADSIDFDNEITCGRYYPSRKSVSFQNKTFGMDDQSRLLSPIIASKMTDFLEIYQ